MPDSTHWSVPADHPVFAGHFPGAPIVPGVMLLDAVLHSVAAAGVSLDHCTIDAVKFLSPAGPDEPLQIQHMRSASGAIQFEILSGSRRIATGTIVPQPTP